MIKEEKERPRGNIIRALNILLVLVSGIKL
jgi:hypothetical protein